MHFIKENRAAVLLIMAGILCIAIGFFRGEAADVFRKAANICMECIGLG